jgi:mRNA deadenylase 3'-5' endonuclease subunit Ccr4
MDRFDLWESKWIKFSDYAKSLPSRFYKDNIALNVILSFKNSNQRLCIANIHIHANPNNNDVKLFQVYYLLKELESPVQKNCGIPLVICGDFNSIPGNAVHSLLTEGYVHSDHEDLNCGSYGELQPAEMFQHTLPLVSAYSSYFQCDLEQAEIARKMNDHTRVPHFTNFSSDFRGTLDYILYSRTNLKVVSLLELMGEDEVENGALPSPNCPSDHIALVAKFSYIPIPKPTRENKLNSGYGPEPTKTNNLCSGDGQLQQH